MAGEKCDDEPATLATINLTPQLTHKLSKLMCGVDAAVVKGTCGVAGKRRADWIKTDALMLFVGLAFGGKKVPLVEIRV